MLSNWMTAALLKTGKIVYLTPNCRPGTAIKHVAIVRNGSRKAARAVSLAMPILESTDAVTVLAGTSDHPKPAAVSEFVASLKWHGVYARARMLTMSGDQSGRLQAEAMDAGAQVRMFRAYSHSWMRQFVFGGVTDDIINAARMSILMAH
jgi:nucleotide-binding universal stress UspA family protein